MSGFVIMVIVLVHEGHRNPLTCSVNDYLFMKWKGKGRMTYRTTLHSIRHTVFFLAISLKKLKSF